MLPRTITATLTSMSNDQHINHLLAECIAASYTSAYYESIGILFFFFLSPFSIFIPPAVKKEEKGDEDIKTPPRPASPEMPTPPPMPKPSSISFSLFLFFSFFFTFLFFSAPSTPIPFKDTRLRDWRGRRICHSQSAHHAFAASRVHPTRACCIDAKV